MEISKIYNFSDFTTKHYRQLLKVCKSKYKFSDYNSFNKDTKFVLWRHDLDFSIHRAYKLSEIEKEEGVSATYFLHLHNEFYNLLEKEISDLIQGIIDNGHQIGLHFDTHYYNINNEDDLHQWIQFESELLKKLFSVDINVFSFHNTTPFTMNCKEWKYGGLINTYAAYFQDNVEYCSDSNGYWRFKRLKDVLENSESEHLQILTHPEWWQDDVMSPWQKIQRCADIRAEKNKNFYKSHLRKFGMKNIDWDGEVN